MADHTYYYKILEAAPPDPLPSTLPTTDLDAKDGFIHLSTAKQVPTTAGLFFKQHSKLWILKLRVKDLDGEIRIPDDLPGCPHVHDSSKGLGKDNIEDIIFVQRSEGQSWSDVRDLTSLED